MLRNPLDKNNKFQERKKEEKIYNPSNSGRIPKLTIDGEQDSNLAALKLGPSHEVKEKRKSASMGIEKSKIYEEVSIGLSLREILNDLAFEDFDFNASDSPFLENRDVERGERNISFTSKRISNIPTPFVSSISSSPTSIYKEYLSKKLADLSKNTPNSIYMAAKNLLQIELETLDLHQESTKREIEERKNSLLDKYHKLIFAREDESRLLKIFQQSMEKKISELSNFRGLNGQFSGYLDHYNIQTSQNSKIQLACIQTSKVNGSFTNKYGNRIVPVEDGELRILSTEGNNFSQEKKKKFRNNKRPSRKKTKKL